MYDLADKIKDRLKNEVNLIFETNTNLENSGEEFFKLLAYRYKAGMVWQTIAEKMFLGLSTVTHLHSPALAEFEKMFGEHYKYA